VKAASGGKNGAQPRKENIMKNVNFSLLTGAMLTMCAAVTLPAQTRVFQPAETVINGRAMTEQQRAEFRSIYGVWPRPGNYWYDARCGLWGFEGREAGGILLPGHDFGPLSPYASRGNTGVFINGRQLNMVEVMYFAQLVGAPIPRGRGWLDAAGNFGYEGVPYPLGNLLVLAQRSRAGSGGRGSVFTERDIVGGITTSAGVCTASGNCAYPSR
jgi:hypothetical protein